MKIHFSCCKYLLAPLALLTGAPQCAAAPDASVSRDIAKLGQLINLPRRPLHAVWQEQRIGDGDMGPSDTRLTAVLVFSPRDIAAIEKLAARHSPARAGFIDVQAWFPRRIRDKAIVESAGTFTRNLRLRARQLDARDFFKLSLRNGALYRVGSTNTCVLALFTT